MKSHLESSAFHSLPHLWRPLQDSGFLDGAFESQNAALGSLSRLLYDELVKSILRIVEKLDLSVQKVTTGEEVGSHANVTFLCIFLH